MKFLKLQPLTNNQVMAFSISYPVYYRIQGSCFALTTEPSVVWAKLVYYLSRKSMTRRLLVPVLGNLRPDAKAKATIVMLGARVLSSLWRTPTASATFSASSTNT